MTPDAERTFTAVDIRNALCKAVSEVTGKPPSGYGAILLGKENIANQVRHAKDELALLLGEDSELPGGKLRRNHPYSGGFVEDIFSTLQEMVGQTRSIRAIPLTPEIIEQARRDLFHSEDLHQR